MKGIFDTAVNAFRVESIRKRLLYTFLILGIFMLGGLVPVPGLDGEKFTELVRNWGQLGNIMDFVSGGGLYRATIFAMGISPYINASIIIQLLQVVIPALEDMSKEGESGRKKLNKITRYSAIGLALVQACLFCYSTRSAMVSSLPVWLNAILVILSFTAGTCLVVWLGEKINDIGIGNGVSLIIFAGIVTRLPDMVKTLYTKAVDVSTHFENQILGAALGILMFAGVAVVAVAIIVFVLYVQNAERRLTVQYSKKVIGRSQRGGNKDYIPLKVNQSGVMPVIFAMSILAIPSMIVTFFFRNSTNEVAKWFGSEFTGSAYYYVAYFLFIIAFTFFYSAIQFHPIEIANNINKNGGAISGIRAGKPTSDFIAQVAHRLNWVDAFFLSLVCIVPTVIGILTGLQNVWFAGTSVLILTGVANDLIVQVESELEVRSPKGFLDDVGLLKGRRR
ncbi:protein translocase subunit secY/sec61 alpha [Ruminococcaceae bacterium YRB3002]|nr:protein translocase subunit secY/sec61 alpha [Ruminococcaceae bacterium YRB3002]